MNDYDRQTDALMAFAVLCMIVAIVCAVAVCILLALGVRW